MPNRLAIPVGESPDFTVYTTISSWVASAYIPIGLRGATKAVSSVTWKGTWSMDNWSSLPLSEIRGFCWLSRRGGTGKASCAWTLVFARPKKLKSPDKSPACADTGYTAVTSTVKKTSMMTMRKGNRDILRYTRLGDNGSPSSDDVCSEKQVLIITCKQIKMRRVVFMPVYRQADPLKLVLEPVQ